jgi:hypothetical protein
MAQYTQIKFECDRCKAVADDHVAQDWYTTPLGADYCPDCTREYQVLERKIERLWNEFEGEAK